MADSLSTDPRAVIDYLDSPPKRYTRIGSALVESPTGECVMFADMDLYMFEGGQFLIQAAAEIARLRAELAKWQSSCTGRHGSQALCVVPNG